MKDKDRPKYIARKQAASLKRWWSIPENRERMNQIHIGGHNNNGGWAPSEAARKQISKTMKHSWKGENGEAARKRLLRAMKEYWNERKNKQAGEL